MIKFRVQNSDFSHSKIYDLKPRLDKIDKFISKKHFFRTAMTAILKNGGHFKFFKMANGFTQKNNP